MVVLGSGGHTTEMLNLTNAMDRDRYWPRCFVFASTDSMSRQKLDAIQEEANSDVNKNYRFFFERNACILSKLDFSEARNSTSSRSGTNVADILLLHHFRILRLGAFGPADATSTPACQRTWNVSTRGACNVALQQMLANLGWRRHQNCLRGEHLSRGKSVIVS